MTTLEALEQTFLEAVGGLRGLTPWQERAWKGFLDRGLPDRTNESYRYVHLRPLYQATPLRLSPSLPYVPSPAIVLPLSQAYLQFSAYLDKQFAGIFDHEKDPFALLGKAIAGEGFFLYLPPNTILETPLLLHQPAHLVIYMARGSSLKLRLMRQGDGSGWIHRRIDAGLDEGAHLQIQLEPHDPETLHFDAIRATLKRDATWKSLSLPASSPLARQDYHIRLVGEGSDAKLYGLVKGESGQHHVHVLMEHEGAHTTSRQQFKGVLEGRIRHTFEGKIYIHQAAQKVDAYQMHNSLILSEKAESKCKPNLEIFADDVKASHGATSGRLDHEALFYLTSRGIPLPKARQLLIDAFCDEVLRETLA